jgi:tRNA(fMet)-specific endonuclease VapC
MKRVFDTNVLVPVLNGDQRAVARFDAEVTNPNEAMMPTIVLGELLYGARSSNRVDANLDRVLHLARLMQFVPVEENIIERFAVIKAALRARGVAKSDADLLIAATALQQQATLVTHDHAFFDGAIDGLTVEDWLA